MTPDAHDLGTRVRSFADRHDLLPAGHAWLFVQPADGQPVLLVDGRQVDADLVTLLDCLQGVA